MIAKVTPRQLAVIHVAKSRLDLDDDYYREMLAQFKDDDNRTIKSAKDLNRIQYTQLMNIFERMGFQPKYKNGSTQTVQSHRTGNQANGKPNNHMTDKQVERIWHLWNQVSAAPEEKRQQALNRFVEKGFKIQNWKWLKVAQAQRLIYILEKMQREQKAKK